MPIAQGDYVAGYTKDELTEIGQSLPNHWGFPDKPSTPMSEWERHRGSWKWVPRLGRVVSGLE